MLQGVENILVKSSEFPTSDVHKVECKTVRDEPVKAEMLPFARQVEKAHSKHRGDSPSRIMNSDIYRKEGLEWNKAMK
jgi:hypothetical protein